MAPVGCGIIPRQRNEEFVPIHLITDTQNEKITLKNNTFDAFILIISISIDDRLMILVPSCFPHQGASNDTDNDQFQSNFKFIPGHSQEVN